MFNVPSPPQQLTLKCERFLGVDFSSNPVHVDIMRSPDSVNMITDDGMFPTKCKGSHLVMSCAGKANGFGRIVDGEAIRLYHAGTKLYKWGITLEEIGTLADKPSKMFQMNKKLWILDGVNYKVFHKVNNNWVLQNVAEIAYIPTTTISRNYNGGGEQFEEVNLLQKFRRNAFLTKQGNTTFQLDTSNIDSATVKVKLLNASGVWEDKIENTHFSVNRVLGSITFTNATGESPVLGRDNLIVEFAKTVAGYAERIQQCDVYSFYGVNGADNRVFVSGNKDFVNQDWFSYLNDPSYFGDLSYSVIGQNSSAIIGYTKQGAYMAIHKESNQQDATVYLRQGVLDEQNKPIFTIKQGVVGVGAVAKRSFAYLRDDALFLSESGVNAIVTNNISGEKYSQDRSYYINSRLLKEKNLSNAVAVSFNGFYYLAINGHVYVADARMKSYIKEAGAESFQYEWFYWDNKNVECWYVENETLYYGSTSGNIYKVEGHYDEAGYPLKCHWATQLITFNDLTRFKTVKNFFLMLNPNTRSSVEIYYRIKSIDKKVYENDVDLFDFNNIDFERFSFNTDYSPHIMVTNKKARKFLMIQFVFANNKADSLGIYEWSCIYLINGKNKRGA